MSDKQSESSGVKIQKLANVVMTITAIIISICGIVLIATNVIIGILVIAIGLFSSYFGYIFIYGIGEMIEDIHCIRRSNATQAEYFDWLKRKRDLGQSSNN